MIRKIVSADNPILRQKCKNIPKIDKKIINLARDLKETLKSQKDPEGVGLAAPQVGKNFRMFAMVYENDILVVINPKVVSIAKPSKKQPKKKKQILEGCLSLPDFYGPLERPQKITIKYQDTQGKKVRNTFTGFSAQIVQHEIDHLNGILFVDNLIKQKKPLYELIDDEWHEVDLPY